MKVKLVHALELLVCNLRNFREVKAVVMFNLMLQDLLTVFQKNDVKCSFQGAYRGSLLKMLKIYKVFKYF